MDRRELSEKKTEQLFDMSDSSLKTTDPDLQEMMDYFIFGEVFHHGRLSDKIRELITLVVLTANNELSQLEEHIGAALKTGLSPVEIKESLYQCAPYLGFPKALSAIKQANKVFKERDIDLPLESQKKVNEENRFEKGLNVQKSIFGEIIDQMHENAPDNQKHIQNYLSAFCFGDIYTRGSLDIKTRELLTLCILSAMGGCESQVRSHVIGNINAGNDKNTLLEAITQCLPYIGFPRMLNAISCINEVIPENK